MSKIGAVVTGGDVEAAMTVTVQRWAADYLAEVAEQHGRARGDLPPFASYIHMPDLSRYNEDQIPTCVVVAPGTIGTPEKHRGTYLARWGVGLAAIVSGPDAEATWDLVGLYLAALRSLVVQHGTLGQFAEESIWQGERYDELDSSDLRTIMAGIVQFDVLVPGVVNAFGGPTEPSADATLPPEEWPTAETVTVSTTARS